MSIFFLLIMHLSFCVHWVNRDLVQSMEWHVCVTCDNVSLFMALSLTVCHLWQSTVELLGWRCGRTDVTDGTYVSHVTMSVSVWHCRSLCVTCDSLLLSHLAEDVDGLTSQIDRPLLRETVRAFTLTNDDLAGTSESTADVQLACNSCQVIYLLIVLVLC